MVAFTNNKILLLIINIDGDRNIVSSIVSTLLLESIGLVFSFHLTWRFQSSS